MLGAFFPRPEAVVDAVFMLQYHHSVLAGFHRAGFFRSCIWQAEELSIDSR
jgi:hypothetical protein